MPLLILEVLNATLLAERNHVMWAAHWARFAASAPDSLTAVCPVEKREKRERECIAGLTLALICVAAAGLLGHTVRGVTSQGPHQIQNKAIIKEVWNPRVLHVFFGYFTMGSP